MIHSRNTSGSRDPMTIDIYHAFEYAVPGRRDAETVLVFPDEGGVPWFSFIHVCRGLGLRGDLVGLFQSLPGDQAKIAVGGDSYRVVNETGLATLHKHSYTLTGDVFFQWVTSVVVPRFAPVSGSPVAGADAGTSVGGASRGVAGCGGGGACCCSGSAMPKTPRSWSLTVEQAVIVLNRAGVGVDVPGLSSWLLKHGWCSAGTGGQLWATSNSIHNDCLTLDEQVHITPVGLVRIALLLSRGQ